MTVDALELVRGEPDEKFWLALDSGRVQLPQCRSCTRWVWPAQPVCPTCHADTLHWIDVQPVGTVYSWTRTWYPFIPERADSLPYVVVVVKLADAEGTRVVGVLAGDDENVAIGARVTGRIAPAAPESLGLPSLVWELRS